MVMMMMITLFMCQTKYKLPEGKDPSTNTGHEKIKNKKIIKDKLHENYIHDF